MSTIRTLSKDQYNKTYQYLTREAGSDKLNEILTYIKNKPVKTTTKLNYLNSIISKAKHDPSSITGDLTKIRELRDKLNVSHKKAVSIDNTTEKQKAVLKEVTPDKLKKALEELNSKKHESTKNLEDYILLKLYSEEPNRNDLREIELTTKKNDLKTKNVLFIPPKKNSNAILKINVHKSSSAQNGKPITKELDVDLTNDIKTLIKKTHKTDNPRIYLFQDRDGTHYSSSGFTHRLNRLSKKLFGIPFSSSTFRKIFWTHTYGDKVKEMEEVAEKMGHKRSTAENYYIAK